MLRMINKVEFAVSDQNRSIAPVSNGTLKGSEYGNLQLSEDDKS